MFELKDIGWVSEFNQDKLKNTKLKFDLVNADDGNVVATPEDKLTPRFLRKLEEDGLKHILTKDDEFLGSYLAEDIINITSGEVLFEAGDLVDNELLSSMKELNIKNINIYSNTFDKKKKPNKSSDYISTNKTDKIIHEMIKDKDLSKAGVKMVLHPLSAFRAMSQAAEEIYLEISKKGTVENKLKKMQSRDELYDVLNYHTYEEKIDKLFSEE